MKKNILLFLLVLMIPFSFADNYFHSEEQQEFMHWPIEIGSGNIVLDQTIYNHHGLLIGTTVNMWDNSFPKFGTYAIDFDGNNDWIDSVDVLEPSEIQTISFWARPHTNSGIIHLIEQTNSGQYHFHLYNDFDTNQLLLGYFNSTGNHNIQTLGSGLTQNTYSHIVVSLDTQNNKILAWIDNTLSFNQTITAGISYNVTQTTIRFGARLDDSGDFDGQMDEMRAFNFVPSTSQVNELFTTNTITLVENGVGPDAPETPVLEIVSYPIINTTTPINGTNVTHPPAITATLNTLASCDLYLNNNLFKSYNNILGFSQEIPSLEAGSSNTYFLYCSFIDGNTSYFELQDKQTFNIDPFPNTQVTFEINALDFNSSALDLYVHTPCLEEGHSAMGLKDFEPYRPKYNPDGAYFVQVDGNGFATFNLTPDTYDFCIFGGRLIFNENNQTTNYDVVDFQGFAQIGQIDIPNQISSSFEIKLEALDLYEIVDPKAYGTTWTGVIVGLLFFLFGAGIVIAGLSFGNGRIVFAGVIMMLLGAGIEIPALLGVIM